MYLFDRSSLVDFVTVEHPGSKQLDTIRFDMAASKWLSALAVIATTATALTPESVTTIRLQW